MKKISTILLTLVLSISMLVPGFSMLPAAYAEGENPAAAIESTDGAAAEDGITGSGQAGAAADEGAAADPQGDRGAGTAENQGAGAAQAGTAGSNSENPDAEPAETEEPADLEETEDTEEAVEFGSYDTISMVDLYDAKAIKIPEEMQGKVTIKLTKSGDGLVFTGTVADLNAMYITLGAELNFDSGSIGRIVFDGLRDKDRKMNVGVEVYFDDCKSPSATVSLKKQMGKKEWSNEGEQSVGMGSSEFSGKHRVALKLKITGKADDDETSVMFRSIRFCKTTVPVLYFNIDESEGTIEAMNNSADHSVECYGSMELVVPAEFSNDKTFSDEYGKQESLIGEDALELEYIRGRGNSTWMDDKKPYKVKFDESVNLFKFGKNKHWTLIANRYDNSFVRNRLTYWLGQQLGMEYTPQCVPVEVVMNGEFLGSYLLCEQIRIGKGRVEIDDLDKIKDVPAITDELVKTGGYLLSMDYAEDDDDPSVFYTDNGMRLFIESPEDNVTYFNEYIKAYTQKVENAIFSADFKDPEGRPYTDYLDIDSAVDYWWVQEFSCNGDAYGGGSTYLYKKRESDTDPGKLYWGPLWDFDYVAWGDLDYESDPYDGLDYTSTAWFDAMKSDPVFIAKVKARWNGGLREKLEELTKEGGRLDKYIEQMETSYDYDHEKWGAFESKLTDYKAEVEQLRGWINKRIAYVDEAVEELSDEAHSVKFMADGELVKEAKVIGALRASDIPEAPQKPGYVFISWTDEDDMDYYEGSRVNSDLVLNAVYIEESEIVQPEEIVFKSYDVYYPVFLEGSDDVDFYYMDTRVMPEGAYASDITWSSSDDDIAEVDEDGTVMLKKLGDVIITASLSNGVTRSYALHLIKYSDLNDYEGSELREEAITLKDGEYQQLMIYSSPMPCDTPEFIWLSTDEEIATVDDLGVVSGVAPGETDILAVNTMTREVLKCKVTVIPSDATGMTVEDNGSIYEITSDEEGCRTAMLIQAKNAKSVTIPAAVSLYGQSYDVTAIQAKAFSKAKKAKTVYVKTTELTKESVKGSMKSSKVTKVKVRVGTKAENKKFVKTYKKIFTKKICGKKVKVS